MAKHQKHLVGLDIPAELPALGLEPSLLSGEAHCAVLPINPDYFFSEEAHEIRAAKRACIGCPIRQDCLKFGLEQTTLGVWGGASQAQLELIRARYGTVNREAAKEALYNRSLLISGKPTKYLAKHFEVCERTIERWRKEIKAQEGNSDAK